MCGADLPDGVVAPHRAVVHDDVDLARDRSRSRRAAARPPRPTRSLTCSSGAAMCLPRRPNFSTITCSGMPESVRDLRSGHPPLRQVRSGRLQSDASHSAGLEDAADDPLELVGDVRRHRRCRRPRGSSACRQLAEAHQRVGRHLGVDLADLAATPIASPSAVDVALARRGRSGSGASRARRTRTAG